MNILAVILVLAVGACFFYIAYALIEAAVISFITWLKGGDARTKNDSLSWIDAYRKRNNL